MQQFPLWLKAGRDLPWKKIALVPLLLSITVFLQAQQTSEPRISIELSGASVQRAIKIIEERTLFRFTFTEDILKKFNRPVTVRAVNATVPEVLQKIFGNSPLTWKLLDQRIILQEDPEYKPVKTVNLEGVITDAADGVALGGATVRISNGKTALTDENGHYIFRDLLAGKYELTVSFTGYKRSVIPDIEVKEGEWRVTDMPMLKERNTLQSVVVTAGRRMQPVAHTSDRVVLEEIRSAQGVVSGIASEQIARSADINAAQVVKRISGITVVDDNFVVARGMNQRYNVTYLSDNIAPSTEQYSRAFAMQLLPARVIDKIMVYKSPRADIFGDFAGAAVKIYTKDALAVKHFDVGVRVGYLPVSTFKNTISYKGGSTDWLGFDDGTRRLPKAVPGFGNLNQANLSNREYVKAFSNVLNYRNAQALPDMQLSVNYYDHFKVGSKKLFNVTSFAFTNETRSNDDVFRQQGNTLVGTGFNARQNRSVMQEVRNAEIGQLNIMENLVFKLNGNNEVYFRNFIMQEGRKTTAVRNSHSNIKLTANGTDQFARSRNIILGFNKRLLYAGNLGGNHLFGNEKHAINWNIGYTSTKYEMPDQRVVNLKGEFQGGVHDAALGYVAQVRSQEEGEGIELERRLGILSRLFLDSRERLYNASVDYTFNVWKGLNLKTGTYHFLKQRSVNRRVYVVHDAWFSQVRSQEKDRELPGMGNRYADPAVVWFRQQDLDRVWSTEFFREDRSGLAVFDMTAPTDTYRATEQYNAGYLSFQGNAFKDKLELNGGIRFEYDRQILAGAEAVEGYSRALLVNRPKAVWLPSVNLSYRPDSVWVIRGSYGKTVNRPEFREMVPFKDFDYLTNENYVGHSGLVTADIDNYDLRVEFYPAGNKGEMISVGGFYKKLLNPIERVIQSIAIGDKQAADITFRNGDYAKVYGVEAEFRKSLSFLPGRLFRNISVIANGAWMYSKSVRETGPKNGDQLLYFHQYSRPLQGQSPYVINAGLFYDNNRSGSKLSLSWNIAGPSIYAVGVYESDKGSSDTTESVYRGSILQLSRHLLDFAYTQRIARQWQVKLSIQNLLSEPVRFAEDNDFNNKYSPEKLVFPDPNRPNDGKYVGDNIYQRYNPGRYFLLSIVLSI